MRWGCEDRCGVCAARNAVDTARAEAGIEGASEVVVFVETSPADAAAAVERYAEAVQSR